LLLLTGLDFSGLLLIFLIEFAFELVDALHPAFDLLPVRIFAIQHEISDLDFDFLFTDLAQRLPGLEFSLRFVGFLDFVVFDDFKVHVGSIDDVLEGVDHGLIEVELSPLLDQLFVWIIG
jgi:hypothetical protein